MIDTVFKNERGIIYRLRDDNGRPWVFGWTGSGWLRLRPAYQQEIDTAAEKALPKEEAAKLEADLPFQI